MELLIRTDVEKPRINKQIRLDKKYWRNFCTASGRQRLLENKANELRCEIYHTHLTSTKNGNDLAKAVKPRRKFCFVSFFSYFTSLWFLVNPFSIKFLNYCLVPF